MTKLEKFLRKKRKAALIESRSRIATSPCSTWVKVILHGQFAKR